MQTIDRDDLVSASFEACAEYRLGGDAAPVCGACGWLDHEHEHEQQVAEVHAFARRARVRSTPRRLAS